MDGGCGQEGQSLFCGALGKHQMHSSSATNTRPVDEILDPTITLLEQQQPKHASWYEVSAAEHGTRRTDTYYGDRHLSYTTVQDSVEIDPPAPNQVPTDTPVELSSFPRSHRTRSLGLPACLHSIQKESGYLGVAVGERGAANPMVPCGWGCGKLVATGHHKAEHEQECAHREVGRGLHLTAECVAA